MGLFDMIGGAIGGIAGYKTQQLANRQSRENIQAQNRGNMALAKYQYSNEIDMWNRANQYNTPEMQMSRYKEAGLNPNLIYGQGSPGLSPNSLPHYQAPQMRYDNPPPLNPLSMLQNYQDYRIKNAQIDLLNSQRRVSDTRAVIGEAEANWAESNARSGAIRKFNEAEAIKFRRVFSEEEFNRFFRYSSPDNMYYLKDSAKETFDNVLSAKWSKPLIDLAKNNADVARINTENDIKQKELEFLNSGGRFFSPVINFLRVFR